MEKKGPLRKFLGEWEPILPRKKLLKDPPAVVFPTVGQLNSDLEALKESKLREWEARGIPSGIRDMAVALATNWASRTAAFAAPDRPDIQKQIVPGLFKRGIEEVSEPWIKAMTE